jgi:hypothetical protein
MNTRFDWFGVATIIVWSALLWSTLRTHTTVKAGAVFRAVALLLLTAFGAMMIWNITAWMR